MEGPLKYKYHFFIGYAKENIATAKELYELLSVNYSVYMDSFSLASHELWTEAISQAQSISVCSLFLISHSTSDSHYQKEEIAAAVSLFSKGRYRHIIIPIYLGSRQDKIKIPYGLHSFHGIYLENELITSVVPKLDHAFKAFVSNNKELQFRQIGTIDTSINKDIQKTEVDRRLKSRMSEIEREKFENRLMNMIGTSKKLYYPKICLVYFDIDRMTNINRIFGDEIGTDILTRIEEIISGMSAVNYFKRIGNDEFVVCFKSEEYPGKIDEFVTELCLKIKNFSWRKLAPGLYVTASFGYAELLPTVEQNTKQEMNRWILRAIEGCNEAKVQGGSGIAAGPLYLPYNSRFEVHYSSMGSDDDF